ncbi:MAG: GNAT family N-acetyltransferase [Candidatus Babeliales bacterium]|nr:GNAT family N-acetyltransferase [Candidatus Babeliales bacterium]
MKTKSILIIVFLSFVTNKIVGAEAKPSVKGNTVQNSYKVRIFSKQDIPQLLNIIRSVRAEFGFDSKHPDAQLIEEELNHTFDIYDCNGNNYFVIENGAKIVGGGGYGTLSDKYKDICEIKGMYLLSETRGLGLGSILLQHILQQAKSHGFKQCYLETNDFMHGANALYTKFKFRILDKPLLAEHKWTNRYYLKELE